MPFLNALKKGFDTFTNIQNYHLNGLWIVIKTQASVIACKVSFPWKIYFIVAINDMKIGFMLLVGREEVMQENAHNVARLND